MVVMVVVVVIVVMDDSPSLVGWDLASIMVVLVTHPRVLLLVPDVV